MLKEDTLRMSQQRCEYKDNGAQRLIDREQTGLQHKESTSKQEIKSTGQERQFSGCTNLMHLSYLEIKASYPNFICIHVRVCCI